MPTAKLSLMLASMLMACVNSYDQQASDQMAANERQRVAFEQKEAKDKTDVPKAAKSNEPERVVSDEEFEAEMNAPASSEKKPGQEALAEREARTRARADEEIRTDRCDQQKVDHLREVLRGMKFTLESVSRGNADLYMLTSHKLVVTRPEGTELTFDPQFGGEYHVIAFGFYRGLKLQAFDGDGYAVNTESAIGDGAANIASQGTVAWATRVLQVSPRGKVRLKVHGYGCTLVVAAEHR